MKIPNLLLTLLILLLFTTCNKIHQGKELGQKDIDLLRSLNLLDEEENVISFYSNYKKSVAGNFYTDKRVATYWLDKNPNKEQKIEFACYQDILQIDSVFSVGATYAPYLLITRKDSSQFKVYVDGGSEERKSFYQEVMSRFSNKSHKD